MLTPEVSRVLQPEGIIEITGTLSNRTFKELFVLSRDDLAKLGYTRVSGELHSTPTPGLTIEGNVITGKMYKLLLKKN